MASRIYNHKHTANSNWARINGIKNMRVDLGLVGLGSVGREVARWANAFDMKILYTQRNQLSKDLEKQFNASYRPMKVFSRVGFYFNPCAAE